MEAQNGTPAVSRPPVSTAPQGGWIVAPGFDLLFIVNLTWLIALLPGFVAADGMAHAQFWQVYFLTTPHRWLTLVLVATDPDRREGRTRLFVALALVAGAIVAGVKWTTGAFVCLALVDYIWNGWHFASQHAGILRIYARKAGGGRPRLEHLSLRLFIFYVIARTAGWSSGWLESAADGMQALRLTDLLVLAAPAVLLIVEARFTGRGQPAKLTYLASVCGLYSALLLALRGRHTVLVIALTAASATFHAVEYLAILTSYAWRRTGQGGPGLFRAMAQRWLGFLAAYVVVLGLAAVMMERSLRELWFGLNLWAAFLHYAYDGLIWKLRRPATAQVLGAA
jgi:hypothetical protein